MSKKFSASMFDTLKSAMAEQRSGGGFKDIMKTEIGNTYIVRLIPNLNDIAKTSYHYFNHGWKSLATGQYVSCICPTTSGQRCPICEERVRLYRGDGEDKENAKMLGRKEQWLVNVYVVSDPSNKENEGKIKILRYGKQLDKIINDAIDGIDKDEFGARIFDLSEEGCNLRIAVEKNDGGFPSYTSSKFLRESAIKGMTDAKMDEIYDGIFELDKVFESKSPDEVKELLDTHFFCEVSATPSPSIKKSSGKTVTKDLTEDTEDTEDDELETDTEVSDDVQDKLDDLMKDL
jgi:hypothetical protein